MTYPVSRYILANIVKWYAKVNGIGNIPKKTNFIIAANHGSYLDHLIIASRVELPIKKIVHFLSKKEHFDSLHQKLWHKYVQAIPLDRKEADTALKKATNFLKKGKIISIYPEGMRTLDGKLQRGKTGIAKLVLGAKVQVLPIGLIGTFDIMPKGKYIPKLKRATMNIGKPMNFKTYYNKKVTKALLRKITEEIMRKIAKLSNQKYNF